MNNRAVSISFLIAILAVIMVQSYVSSVEEQSRKKFGTEVLVLVAKSNIREMENITEAHLELKPIPKTFLEPSAVTEENTPDDEEQAKKAAMKRIVGTVALVPIRPGEQITYNKVTEPSIRTGLSPQVAPGKRAVAIPVTEHTSVAKLVKPGDRVDVIAVLSKRLAKTILQDVAVLAVGKNVTNNLARFVEYDPFTKQQTLKNLNADSNFQTVTIEVEAQQAQLLALIMADEQNRVSLSLRNNDDSDRAPAAVTTLNDVLNDGMRPAPQPNQGGTR